MQYKLRQCLVCQNLLTEMLGCFRSHQKPVDTYLKGHSWMAQNVMGRQQWLPSKEVINRQTDPQTSIIWIWDDDIGLCFDYRFISRTTLFADAVYANCGIMLTLPSSVPGGLKQQGNCLRWGADRSRATQTRLRLTACWIYSDIHSSVTGHAIVINTAFAVPLK
jgi:hypothetical protein